MMTIKELEKKYEIDIMIANKDRHSELALCLQSLRSQTFQNFNVIIGDESQTPLNNCYYLLYIIERMKYEGHKMKAVRNHPSFGVCYIRNKLIEEQVKFKTDANLCLRLDDDILLEPDYIHKLLLVLEAGYDMASGIVPLTAQPEFSRELKFVQPIINEHKLDKEGKLILNNDDCGYTYLGSEILPTHHFRTNLLYKSILHDKVRYPKILSKVGFREEGFFSFRAIIKGFTIGVHTGAVCYHFATPSGGVRTPDYADCVKLDHSTFVKWIKEQFGTHGNFIETYNMKLRQKGLLK